MNIRSRVSVFFLLVTLFSLVFAQRNSPKSKPVEKAVLIVKNSSNLEISVSRIIRDSLSKTGYTVKEVSFADAKKENASLYSFSIVFNAIKPGNDIDPRIQKFIASKSGSSSKVLLYTVYGNPFNKKGKYVDATTQATQALQPQLIANHILRSLKL